jgi:hypothetical protein
MAGAVDSRTSQMPQIGDSAKNYISAMRLTTGCTMTVTTGGYGGSLGVQRVVVMNPNPKERSKVGILVWGHTGEVRMDGRFMLRSYG